MTDEHGVKLFRRNKDIPCPEPKPDLRDVKIKYVAKKKIAPVLKYQVVSDEVLEMIKYWNMMGKSIPSIQPVRIPKEDKPSTKIYSETVKFCRMFLNGTIFDNKDFVPPYEKFEKRPYTFDDFKIGITIYKFVLIKTPKLRLKTSLLFFLKGEGFLSVPSVFFNYCTKEPKDFNGILYEFSKEMDTLKERWEKITGLQPCLIDIRNFNEYLIWAVPHFDKMSKGFQSLAGYTPLGLLEFMTFGTLARYIDRGKSINSSKILNQGFFKDMMDEYRVSHGYTV